MDNKKVRNYKLYIEDILGCIKKINNYVKDMTFEEFSKDEKTIDAVIRNFEIIGEASKQLPKEIKNKYSNIKWKTITGFRNVIVHEYFGIDLEIMWDIIKEKLNPLEKDIKKILKNSITL